MDYRSSVFYRDGGVSVTRLDGTLNFDVSKIFDCGQTFRFDRIEGSQHGAEWGGVVRGRYISVGQDGDTVYLYNVGEEEFEGFFRRYFDLDREYGRIDEDLLSRSDKPELRDAVEKGRGIRILRQEPWETLCSFIISQNNNIPRIKSLVSALSREAGEPAVCDGMTARGASEREYSFPVPAAVCRLGEERLREMKTGFRAGYICGAAEAQLPGRGPSLADVAACGNTADASAVLQKLRGVGPKVAACVLLFGFGRLDSFPVDVWIKKVIGKYFPGGFDAGALGPYAGVAQQYLFYRERWLVG
ncbi:MAG: DNA-3-methyladenine glycosylase 2 family protein [Clostridia bacterium]|nr:DNA-3-methyladenine glycosylase 2 family protein [Clostridia bacterium]